MSEKDVESAAVRDLAEEVRREVAETKKYGDDIDWAPIPVGRGRGRAKRARSTPRRAGRGSSAGSARAAYP